MNLKSLFSKTGKQEGTFSALIYSCFERGFDDKLFPYNFTFPPCIWGFKKNRGYVIFDEGAYFRTCEESYKAFCDGTFASEEDELRLHKEIEKEDVPESAETCIPYIGHLATLYGELFGATVYAEALHEPFAKRHYEGENIDEFFTIASLPSFATFTYRKLKSALDRNSAQLRKQSSGYYLAAEEAGLVDATLNEYENPEEALKEMEAEQEENKAKQEAYRKSLSPKMQQLFDYIRLGSHVRDRRKDAMGALCVLLTEATQKILASLNLRPELAAFCHCADFNKGIPENYAATLEKRERGFAYISYHDTPRREPLESYEAGLQVLELRHPLAQRFLERIPPRDIIRQEGNLSLLCTGWYDKGMTRQWLSRYYAQDPGPFLICYKGRRGSAHYDQRKLQAHAADAHKRFLEGPLAEHATFTEVAQVLKTHEQPIVLRDLTEQELCELLHELAKQVHALIAATLFTEVIDETLVQEWYGDEAGFDAFLALASKDGFPSLSYRRKKALATAAPRWIFTDYVKAPLPEEIPALRERALQEEGGLDELQKGLTEIEEGLERTREAQEAYLAKAPPEIVKLFEFIQLCKRMRDERSDLFIRFDTLATDIVRELYGRKKLPERLVQWAYYADFPSEYQQESYPELLERRSRGVCKYADDNGEFFTEWSFDYDEIMEGLTKAVDSTTTELEGRVAMQGKASGIARIIMSEEDFPKFREGDILITSMTRPEFVPLMKRAAAIVTDEGGLTCHAAIISRELKKPCIIGTGNATRTLQDGQEITVDADNGRITLRDAP